MFLDREYETLGHKSLLKQRSLYPIDMRTPSIMFRHGMFVEVVVCKNGRKTGVGGRRRRWLVGSGRGGG